jgi:hypothetical protein
MLIQRSEAWDLLFETTWVNSLTEASEYSPMLPAPYKQRPSMDASVLENHLQFR